MSEYTFLVGVALTLIVALVSPGPSALFAIIGGWAIPLFHRLQNMHRCKKATGRNP